MTNEQLRQTGLAMIAFCDGKQVQYWSGVSKEWRDTQDPSWNRSDLYRPKPEPVTRPWNCPDDVPGPVCWIRAGDKPNGQAMVIRVNSDGVAMWNAAFDNVDMWPWKALVHASAEYSTDRKTWHPCTVEA